jgi:hypothetical protein
MLRWILSNFLNEKEIDFANEDYSVIYHGKVQSVIWEEEDDSLILVICITGGCHVTKRGDSWRLHFVDKWSTPTRGPCQIRVSKDMRCSLKITNGAKIPEAPCHEPVIAGAISLSELKKNFIDPIIASYVSNGWIRKDGKTLHVHNHICVGLCYSSSEKIESQTRELLKYFDANAIIYHVTEDDAEGGSCVIEVEPRSKVYENNVKGILGYKGLYCNIYFIIKGLGMKYDITRKNEQDKSSPIKYVTL